MTSHTAPNIVELDAEQLDALLLRVEAGQLTPEDVETLVVAPKSYEYVTQLIDQRSTTIARLRKLLFRSQTEKTAAVTGQAGEPTSSVPPGQPDAPDQASGGDGSAATKPHQKPKGLWSQRRRGLPRGEACQRAARAAQGWRPVSIL